MPTDRLAGHALVAEGAPFVLVEGSPFAGTRRLTGKWGSGLCSCGILSHWLTSNAQRKAWHRGHKQEVRDAR